MRTATRQTEIYKFNELDEYAKENALEKLYDLNVNDEWWEFVYDDAKEIGKLMGIEIDNLYFSGFSSQGDGACLEGSYSYKKRSVKNIKEYAPKDTELQNIALSLSKVQRKHFYQLSAHVKHSGFYYHEHCTAINVYGDNNLCDFYVSIDTENEICELLRDFMHWIYIQLETSYDFLTSEESIIETINANEYEFTAEGDIY